MEKSIEMENQNNFPEQNDQAKILHEMTHICNNCFKPHLRAIKHWLSQPLSVSISNDLEMDLENQSLI